MLIVSASTICCAAARRRTRRAVYDPVYRGELSGAVRAGSRQLFFMREIVLASPQEEPERRSWRSQ